MTTFQAEKYESERDEIAGWPVNITVYQLEDAWVCRIDNVSPGALVAKGTGNTADEAEEKARKTAARRLARTRRQSSP